MRGSNLSFGDMSYSLINPEHQVTLQSEKKYRFFRAGGIKREIPNPGKVWEQVLPLGTGYLSFFPGRTWNTLNKQKKKCVRHEPSLAAIVLVHICDKLKGNISLDINESIIF